MPTASQVYLAIDILTSGMPTTPSSSRLADISFAMLRGALETSGWTGRVDGGCVEYGRPPAEDPQAAIKVALYDRAMEWLDGAEKNGPTVGIDSVRAVLCAD